jgi:hypothetical protein
MMTLPNSLLVSGLVIKDTILSPGRAFCSKGPYDTKKGVMILFLTGLLITFLKTFMVKRKVFAVTFFNSPTFNSLLLWLNSPQVLWAAVYVAYFIFILLILLMCKVLNGRVDAMSLVIALMSVSGIGVVLQVFFYGMKFVLPHNVIVVCSYVAYAWVIFVSLRAVEQSQKIPFIRSVVCFVITAIPAVFLAGLPAICPYLAWLIV